MTLPFHGHGSNRPDRESPSSVVGGADSSGMVLFPNVEWVDDAIAREGVGASGDPWRLPQPVP